MKKAFIILVVILIASFVAEAQTLPTKAKTYLKNNYGGWEIAKFNKVEYQENKSVAKGDFNGDGKTDYAVVITKDERVYTLVLFASKNSFKAFNLLAQSPDEHWIAGIGIVKKGDKLDVFTDQQELVKTFRLKTDGVYLYDGEGHGQTYYWQGGKFLSTHDF